ncbi:LapA family protein [Brevibacterium album]|uniref:LapA family protein n=1 Tax=Brevibacterium album TaxID=417948 RepID=UPI000414C002|nr:lipopolysaccharide assembly protein LapA domain-containing protein [Brevibacterium album]
MSTSGDPRDPAQPTGNLSDELPAELFEPESSPQAAPAPAPSAQTPPSPAATAEGAGREEASAEPPAADGRGERGSDTPVKHGKKPRGAAPEASRGLSGGAWVSLIAGTAVLVLLLVFIVQNNTTADFQYFGWHFSLPLGVAMLLAAIAGVLVAGIVGSVRIFVLQRRLKRIERVVER